MNQSARMTGLMLATMMAACSPSQPSNESEVAQPAEYTSEPIPAVEPEPIPVGSAPVASTPGVPAPDIRSGSNMVVYACDDGSSLTVTYDEYAALVKLSTGATTLSRAESASNPGYEAYLGEELSLYRNSNLVQLQVAGKSRNCIESPSSS